MDNSAPFNSHTLVSEEQPGGKAHSGKQAIDASGLKAAMSKAKGWAFDVDQLKEASKASNGTVQHTKILNELLDKLEPVDFRELAEIEENEKLKNSHFQILTIETVLELATENNWGICRNHDFIYLFNGACWTLFEADEIKTFLGAAAEKMGVNKFNSRHWQFKDSLYKQFLASAYLTKPERAKEQVLINLKNGTFEITPKGTRLRDFDRKDFLTYQLPFEYNPTATALMFEAYLNKVLPDKQRQDVLAEYLGYVFIKNGRIKEEKVLFLYGTGANGKSVFQEVVNALFGPENTSQYSLQDLTNENGYYRAMIANKLVNYASEISGKLAAATFKQLASGETVTARLPYGNPMQISDYARLIFNVNDLPRDVEQTDAFFRRFLIVPFDVTIPEAEQDKQLHIQIIEKELSGVFNWVLTGLNRLLNQNQFTVCEASIKARETYKTESDSVKMFIQESGFKPHPTDYTLIKELFIEYRTYCSEDGYSPVKKTNFINRLRNSQFQVERKNQGNVVFLSRTDRPF